MSDNALLKPIKIGPYELANRVFMAPMTRSRADNPENAPTELHAQYYQQRASAGLLINRRVSGVEAGCGLYQYPGHSQQGPD